MEEKKKVIDRSLNGLVYQALDTLATQDKEVEKIEETFSDAVERLNHVIPLDEEIRELLNDYDRKLALLNAKNYRHLYLQGAKDCVALLRELGVIK